MQISTWSIPPIMVVGGIVVLALVILFILWRSGWSFRGLKKLKIGPVEGERFEEHKDSGANAGASFNNVDVQVKDSRFEGDVGDIGGVIIKRDFTDGDKS